MRPAGKVGITRGGDGAGPEMFMDAPIKPPEIRAAGAEIPGPAAAGGLALLGLHRDATACKPSAARSPPRTHSWPWPTATSSRGKPGHWPGAGSPTPTGDPTRASEAVEAFTRAHAVTSAAGVVADTQRLLQLIAAQD